MSDVQIDEDKSDTDDVLQVHDKLPKTIDDLAFKSDSITNKTKSDVLVVAQTYENENLNQRKRVIRFTDDTIDNSKDDEDNQTIEDIVLNTNNEYPTPNLKTDSITNFCWWNGCFPMHNSCKICSYPEPDFWNCFLRTVFIVLFFMLLATAGFIFYALSNDYLVKAFNTNFILVIGLATISIFTLNYFMLSFVAGRCFCVSYFVLFIVVAVYSIFLGALTTKFDTEAFFYALVTTSAIVLTLFGITWCPCFCFSRTEIVLPIALAVAMGSGFFLHYLISNNYRYSYSTRHLVLIAVLVLIHAMVISFEIGRLLCSNCLDPYCMDYGLGAYLLYTMFLQISFYWLCLIFTCLRCHYIPC